MKKKINVISNVLNSIPNGVKTLAWSLFYQGIVFECDSAIPELNKLNINPIYLVVVAAIITALSKWAAKKLATMKKS